MRTCSLEITDSNGKEFIRFKVAQANHKRGPFDAPTTTYKNNPYYQFTPLYKGLAILVDSIVPLQSDAASTDSSPSGEVVVLPESYSSTSSILNIDMTSLADKLLSSIAYHKEELIIPDPVFSLIVCNNSIV